LSGRDYNASFFQLNHQRRGTVARMLLIAHEDVLVFTREPAPAAAVEEGADR